MIRNLFYKLFWKFYDDDIKSEDFDKDDREGVFLEMSMNERIPEMLKAILKGDRIRYFKASTEMERNMIRGEYLRTLYLYSKISPKTKIKKEQRSVNTKIAGRYAKN